MKKFLFSLLFLIPLLSFSQNCTELQVTMFESYGDGWNGNYLTVGDNSITLPFCDEGVDTICVNLDECKIQTGNQKLLFECIKSINKSFYI